MKRIILVGLGARSRIWRQVLDENPRTCVVGLVDVNPERLHAAAQDYPDAVTGTSLAAVAKQADADAVILITPPAGRERQIAEAGEAGLAILAEKPLADSLATACEYVEAAESAGVPLMVGLNFRYLEVTKALKSLFRDYLGRPEFGRFTYERWRDGTLARLNKYPLTMTQPMLWEQSIHHFDLMRHVYEAEPVEISAHTFNPSWSMYRDDANVSAFITFDNGVKVSYLGTWAGNWNQLGFNWRSDCEKGVAIQREMFSDLAYALRDDASLTPVALPPFEDWVNDAAGLLEAFVAHLEDGVPLACSGRDHLKTICMVEACILSSATRSTIKITDLEM